MTLGRSIIALFAGLIAMDSTSSFALEMKDRYIFSPALVKNLLPQCSRPYPQNIDGTWMPTAKQINDLEARLPEIYTRVLGNPFPQNFLRQYGGVIIAGRKLIYLNASPAGPAWIGDESKGDWSKEPKMMCGGGIAFFGVLYDPDTNAFTDFEMNVGI